MSLSSKPTIADGPAPQPILSTKVGRAERRGVEGWLHFHAAFSHAFARSKLEALVPPGGVVVDPFCGSGTTARAAAVRGASCFSTDLNPALIALAKATLLDPDVGEEVVDLLTRVNLGDFRNGYRPTPLSQDWMHPRLGTDLEAWRAAFAENLGRDANDFARGLLVHAARDLIRPQVGSNPTWPKPPLRRRRRSTGAILLKHAHMMIDDLRGFAVGAVERKHTLLVADARRLPLQNAQADGILTSPPYLSRIDYPRATLPELLVLGEEDGQELGRLRSKTMGGVTTGGARPGAETDDAAVAEILKKIQSHPSKASKSYYLVLAERYFADLRKCVREMIRVLRPGGRGSIVVQSSYYKDVLIDLPNIVAAMLKTEGASASVPQSLRVSQHYGHLSPHQRRYVANKSLTEAVVDFSL